MSPRNWHFRIVDILMAIDAIQSYTAELNYEDFARDRKTVDAVVRNLMIVGEAATHVPDEICQEWDALPWKEMRAMRNIVVHEFLV